MLVLGVETSTSRGSLALIRAASDKNDLVDFVCWEKQNSHSELVTAFLESLLKKNQIGLSEIEAYAIGVGPGSFTGIRVGLSLVRSFSYALKKDCFAISSHRLLASEALKKSKLPVLVINLAFKNMYYISGFEMNGTEVVQWLETRAVRAKEVESIINKDCLAIGDGLDLCLEDLGQSAKNHLSLDQSLAQFPDARTIWTIIQEDKIKKMQWDKVLPLYIRASEAEEKLRGGLLKPPPRL